MAENMFGAQRETKRGCGFTYIHMMYKNARVYEWNARHKFDKKNRSFYTKERE